MFQGLLNGSLLLAGLGFIIIVMTTPNASSEILERLSNKMEISVNGSGTLMNNVCKNGCNFASDYSGISEPLYFKDYSSNK